MVITKYPQKWPTKAKSANSSHAFKKPSGALGSNDYKFSGLLHLQSGSNLCYQSWKLTLLKVSVNPKQGWTCSTESSIPKLWEEKKERRKTEGKIWMMPSCIPLPLHVPSLVGEKYILLAQTEHWEKQYCPERKRRMEVWHLAEPAQLLPRHHQWAHLVSTSVRIWNTCWQASAYKAQGFILRSH